MHNRWKGLIGQILVILVLFGHPISNASTAGQKSQDQDTRTQAGPPPSLQRKRQCLEAQLQKWQQEGKNLQPIGEILQDFPPLFEQQKFAEAELVVDRALKVTGGTCPGEPTSPPPSTAPSTQSDPPPSLQGKMERLQALVQQKQEDEVNLQPFMEVMQGLGPLMQQKKFSEAEALLDRALKVLAETVPAVAKSSSIGPPLIAYGAREPDVRQQIFVVHPDGTGKRRLTQEGKQNLFPAWSPDGRKMAFASDRSSSLQIWVMKADGTRPRQLTTEGENSVPAWAPDGKRLAFGSNRTGHYEIWAMESDGTDQKQLTTTDAENNGPTWSPDGRRIAFHSTQGGYSAIWVMDQDGSHLTQLTTPYGDRFRDSNAPAWSPDGAKIAFWSGRAHGDGNVWVMDADGSNRRQLTDQPAGVNCGEPAWSDDGRKIIFESNRPGSERIGTWIMDADGSNQRVLTTNANVWGRPSWQPVGGKP
jgi:TolB protein